jgi:hypothetical protein
MSSSRAKGLNSCDVAAFSPHVCTSLSNMLPSIFTLEKFQFRRRNRDGRPKRTSLTFRTAVIFIFTAQRASSTPTFCSLFNDALPPSIFQSRCLVDANSKCLPQLTPPTTQDGRRANWLRYVGSTNGRKAEFGSITVAGPNKNSLRRTGK